MFYSENLKKSKKVQHCFFSRKNGKSEGIYESLNCGLGSNDKIENVESNLEIVAKNFNINKKQLVLMNQSHSNIVQIVEKKNILEKVNADAILTESKNLALGVLTADCAPILIYESNKNIIGCIHAGWKGALGGIIENTFKKLNEMGGDTRKVIACIGPCIAQKNYEVKEDFYEKFIKNSLSNELFFIKNKSGTYNFNLRAFIIKKLNNYGVLSIENIDIDSFEKKNQYFSHRRAKKLGENDYGRCISVIKKTSLQN